MSGRKAARPAIDNTGGPRQTDSHLVSHRWRCRYRPHAAAAILWERDDHVARPAGSSDSKSSAHRPLGADIRGIELAGDADDEVFKELRRVLDHYHVIAVPARI